MAKKPTKSGKQKQASEVLAEQSPTVQVRTVSHVGRDVNIASKIIQNIESFQERPLTAGEAIEVDLGIELKELGKGYKTYLEGINRQRSVASVPIPYKELEAYTLYDSQVFFGREKAIRELYEAMQRGRLTILQAESGAGKTSLLQAGITPLVLDEQHMAILIRPQFQNPSLAIKKCLLRDLKLTPLLAKTSLMDFLQRMRGFMDDETTLYMILDQFEEFFAKQTLEADRQEFIRDLAECLNDATLNVRWVIAITSDALGQLGKFEPYVRAPLANMRLLELFTRKDAEEVLWKTAERHGLSFEDGLLERILDDLGNHQDDPIAPTQMQLVCAALYKGVKDGDKQFTIELYEQKGCARGILRDYIENVLRHQLPSEERPVAHKILEALVTSEKKRVMRSKTDLETTLKSKGIDPIVVDSALDHLVIQRLLRRIGDDGAHLQFEIVHDYLLQEIEINDSIRHIKETGELLEQGVKYWERQRLLLPPDALKIIDASARDLSISPDMAKVLFLSALEYQHPASQWRDLIPAEEQKKLAESLLANPNTEKNRNALWLLRRHLTLTQRLKLALTRYSLNLGLSFRRVLFLALQLFAVLIIGILAINTTKKFVPWNQVTSFNNQCLNGKSTANPLVAMDALDISHVAAYDPSSHRICETQNAGVKWTSLNKDLPPNLAINAIAIHGEIFLATNNGIYHRVKNDWRTLENLLEPVSAIQRMAISSDRKTLYLVGNQNHIYSYDLSDSSWQDVNSDGITGSITDLSVNYKYLAVSTTDGLWYKELAPNIHWSAYDFVPDKNMRFRSFKMAYEVQSWKHSWFDRFDADAFLAVTEKGELYSGNLTEPLRLSKVSNTDLTEPLTSLAVSGYSRYSSGPDGLYCQQNWSMLDPEWWLYWKGWSTVRPCT